MTVGIMLEKDFEYSITEVVIYSTLTDVFLNSYDSANDHPPPKKPCTFSTGENPNIYSAGFD